VVALLLLPEVGDDHSWVEQAGGLTTWAGRRPRPGGGVVAGPADMGRAEVADFSTEYAFAKGRQFSLESANGSWASWAKWAARWGRRPS
jgi:hypothetical protein